MRAQLQYPGAFTLQMTGTLLITAVEFVGVWALVRRFGNIRGWELPEVAILYGLVMVGYSTAEIVGRGFDKFSGQVRGGGFDRLLLRPRHTVLQVAGWRRTYSAPAARYGNSNGGPPLQLHRKLSTKEGASLSNSPAAATELAARHYNSGS